MNWTDLTSWWLDEVATDPAYEEVVNPLLFSIFAPQPGELYLDLGCGEGRIMPKVAEFGALVHGLDVNPDLVEGMSGVFVALLPEIPVRDSSYDGVYSVLTLEHLEDVGHLFAEAARVTRVGGVFAIVINHPIWTAPNSSPITDADGEVMWRPGEYFARGHSAVPVGNSAVVFHHRTMADLLTSAAEAGWSLRQMVEQPHHEFDDQRGIPRLLACRWEKR